MKTATIRQIRNDFPRVLAWVEEGEEVTVLNRSRPVARLCPPRPQAPAAFKPPNFTERVNAFTEQGVAMLSGGSLPDRLRARVEAFRISAGPGIPGG